MDSIRGDDDECLIFSLIFDSYLDLRFGWFWGWMELILVRLIGLLLVDWEGGRGGWMLDGMVEESEKGCEGEYLRIREGIETWGQLSYRFQSEIDSNGSKIKKWIVK